jgi:hypothetical protein
VEALSPIFESTKKKELAKNKECVHKCTLDWNFKMDTYEAWHNKSKIQKRGLGNYLKSNLKIQQQVLVEAKRLITKSPKNQLNF